MPDSATGTTPRNWDSSSAPSQHSSVERTFQGVPEWYSRALWEFLQDVRGEAQRNVRPYPGDAYAKRPKIFEDAERQAQANILRRMYHDDTYKLGREEIKKATARSGSDLVMPHLDALDRQDNGYIQDYLARFRHNVITPLREETKENLLEDILPKINSTFATSGAYHGSARQKSIERAVEKQQRSMDREISRLMMAAEDRGMEYEHRQKGMHLTAAQLKSDILNRDKESHAMNANMLSLLAQREQAQQQMDTEALNSIGRAREAHEQKKIDAKIKRHEHEQMEPERKLAFENAMMRGHQLPTQTVSMVTPTSAPPPPNPTVQGVSMLQSLMGRNAVGFRRGGSVRKRYAEGGLAYPDSALPAFNTPEMADTRQIGNELRHGHGDPRGHALTAAGAHMMLAGRRGAWSPSEAFILGNSAGGTRYAQIQEANLGHKQQAANLLQKINESRLAQQGLLADVAHKNKMFGEQQRVHNSLIAEHTAKADYYRQKANLGNRPSAQEMEDMPTKEMNPKREEAIKEAHQEAYTSLNIIKAAIKADEKLKDIEGDQTTEWLVTHPKSTFTLGPAIAGAYQGKKPKKLLAAQGSVNDLISSISSAKDTGIGRSVAHLKQFQEGKPGIGQSYTEYNQGTLRAIIEKGIESYQMAIENAARSGDTPRSINQLKKKLAEFKELEKYLGAQKSASPTAPPELSTDEKKEQLRQMIAGARKELG